MVILSIKKNQEIIKKPFKRKSFVKIIRFSSEHLYHQQKSQLISAETNQTAQVLVCIQVVNKQQLMQARIQELELIKNYKQGLKSACKANHISCKLLNGLTLRKMQKIYNRTLTHYQNSPQKAQTAWFENQLRLFHWMLIVESYLLDFPLKQFKEENWKKIQQYFFPKSIIILQFECCRLLSRAESEFHVIWCEEESLILQEILEDKRLFGKWNEVSRFLYEISAKRFYRSGKQCREQWYNHLDFTKKHGQWTEEEDLIILRQVLSRGHKWAQICKGFMPHRTEHMLKNRFKSLIIKYERPKQKWNLDQKKKIKRILSKLRYIKDNLTENQLKIEKSKTSVKGFQQPIESQQNKPKVQEIVLKPPCNNLLSIDNKVLQEFAQNQQNPGIGSCQNYQNTNNSPEINNPFYHHWQGGTWAYHYFDTTQAGPYWVCNTQNNRCFLPGAWQLFGYMI